MQDSKLPGDIVMKLPILWVGWAWAGAVVFAAVPVELVPLQQQDLKITTTQPISVEAFYTADIGARVSGYVAEVLVDIGSSVEAGQPLLKIDVPERAARVQVLVSEMVERAAAVAAAEANRKAAASEQQRVRTLADRGSVTEKAAVEAQHRLEQANAALQSAEASLGVGRARLAEAEQMLAYATLSAPFDGIVAARNVDPGDLVTADAATTLLQVMAVNPLRVVTYVPEREAVRLNNGDPVTLSFDALPGQSFSARITRTAGVLDPKTRRMRAEIDLGNSKGLLFPGMYGKVVIELQQRRNALVLPASAIRLNDGPPHVYAVEGGRVKRIPVELGADDGILIEITSGLTGKEQIVANRIGRLQHGEAVTVTRRMEAR
ncbi:MAG: efflux RND transporter periplasmic adaptor subunit [Planctomycetes bacterium]|nr:efflux RND transporter periplasmic adaptor subunit [Planctomycetota bacterium]